MKRYTANFLSNIDVYSRLQTALTAAAIICTREKKPTPSRQVVNVKVPRFLGLNSMNCVKGRRNDDECFRWARRWCGTIHASVTGEQWDCRTSSFAQIKLRWCCRPITHSVDCHRQAEISGFHIEACYSMGIGRNCLRWWRSLRLYNWLNLYRSVRSESPVRSTHRKFY